jgi:hypothetical protein
VPNRGTGSVQYPPHLLLVLRSESIVKVLQLAQGRNVLKFGQLTVAV